MKNKILLDKYKEQIIPTIVGLGGAFILIPYPGSLFGACTVIAILLGDAIHSKQIEQK